LPGQATTFKAAVKALGSPEAAAAAMGLQARLPEGIVQGSEQAELLDPVRQMADQQLIQQFPAFDQNRDGSIDRVEAQQLEADVQEAQQVIDLIGKNPQARSAALSRFGAAQIAEWEALVTAVKKRASLTAQRRVGLGG
jgi:hypothetical protein